MELSLELRKRLEEGEEVRNSVDVRGREEGKK